MSKTKTYVKSFESLQEIAEKTSAGLGHTDIDQVIPMLEDALGHNKVLMGHLDNVEKMVQEMLGESLVE